MLFMTCSTSHVVSSSGVMGLGPSPQSWVARIVWFAMDIFHLRKVSAGFASGSAQKLRAAAPTVRLPPVSSTWMTDGSRSLSSNLWIATSPLPSTLATTVFDVPMSIPMLTTMNPPP